MKGRLARAAVMALCLALAPRMALAQAQNLPELSLEELMSVQVQPVFGASERLQPVTEAPASVTIITADDIRRYGYRTLGDILRSVRGFVISNDRNYTYAGTRGFSQPGDYNTRILLLVNGHRVNDNVYDQASIGHELNLDVGIFERVEVIRGPASSLYGTSAFFAVINIITMRGSSIEGLTVDGAAGTLGLGMGRVTFGETLDNGTEVILSAKHHQRAGMDRIYFPEFDTPETNFGIAEDLDREVASTVYGQLRRGGFTLTASAGERTRRVPTASYFTDFNNQDAPERTSDRRAMAHAIYERTTGRTTWSVDFALDHMHYEGVYPYAGADFDLDQATIVNRDASTGNRWTLGARARRPLPGRQTVTLGAEHINNFTQQQANWYDAPVVDRSESDVASHQAAFFIVDEIRVLPWLIVNGGLRHDRYEDFARTTPRGGVIVMPSPSTSFKYLYGEAFRAPNAYELYYYPNAGLGEPLNPESIRTHELAWEQYVGEWLRTSVSAYRSTASQLITFVPAETEEEFAFDNADKVSARGIEFEAELRSGTGMQLVGSATFQRSVDAAGARLVNWPSRVAEIRGSVPGPWAGSSMAAEVQHVGARRTLAGGWVRAYTVAHAAFNAKLSSRMSLTATARNIFNLRFCDPASGEHVQNEIQQTGRVLRLDLRWTLFSR